MGLLPRHGPRLLARTGGKVIEELRQWLAPQGLDEQAKLDDNDPHKPIVDAARYLRTTGAGWITLATDAWVCR